MPRSVASYLEETSQHYDKIDPTLIFEVWEEIKQHFVIPKIIHIVGTNGKGSTGRFLALLLKEAGFHTGHYTSPHIEHFNERIWIDGANISDSKLENAHQALQIILRNIKHTLSYFEYTTLLGLYAMAECEYVVLEAGLGGEFDATNIFPKQLSLITNIGYDHQDYLGETLELIASTKIRSVNNDAIIGIQSYEKVYEIARHVVPAQHALEKVTDMLNADIRTKIKHYIDAHHFASYFYDNISLAYAAMTYLRIFTNVNDYPFKAFDLSARFERINSHIIVDSGHNPLAAGKIVKEFKNKKITLIYNSFKDKDYEEVLRVLKPIIKTLEILNVPHPRCERVENIALCAQKLNIPYRTHQTVSKDKYYLVFGSFSVVEHFLKQNR